jgi:hypothetical protein
MIDWFLLATQIAHRNESAEGYTMSQPMLINKTLAVDVGLLVPCQQAIVRQAKECKILGNGHYQRRRQPW